MFTPTGCLQTPGIEDLDQYSEKLIVVNSAAFRHIPFVKNYGLKHDFRVLVGFGIFFPVFIPYLPTPSRTRNGGMIPFFVQLRSVQEQNERV